MQTQPLGKGRKTVLRIPAKTSIAGNGVLLALDGHCLERPALSRVLQLCRQTGKRLDILLLNAPKQATLMLGRLLQQLEKEGIDYRLTSGEGEMVIELPLYLHRFKHIAFILMHCLDKWEAMVDPALTTLRQEGYKVLSLLDRGNELSICDAEWQSTT